MRLDRGEPNSNRLAALMLSCHRLAPLLPQIPRLPPPRSDDTCPFACLFWGICRAILSGLRGSVAQLTSDLEVLQGQVESGILEHKVAEEVALIEVTERVDGLQSALQRHISSSTVAVRQNTEELRSALAVAHTR